MNTIELIKKKRDGKPLSGKEFEFLIKSYTSEKMPDYQFSALLMAIYINGMNRKETAALTNAMLHNGRILSHKKINMLKIDKHSTGGVGDKTSLIIAPIVAAAGVYVPMISGRGLGHTGGTLDKLESIPGFKTNLNTKNFSAVLKKCGAALVGQTNDIAPADKLIYALRDVTGTIESIPLITASIMSKKLAEGIDGLVLDVKTGSGAFMANQKDAERLAHSLISTAKRFNKKVIAFITDMNQPLGNNIGNWLEVLESIDILKNNKKGDLLNLCLHISGSMIYLGGKTKSIKDGKNLAKQLITDGTAFNKFKEIVSLQGGDVSFIDNPKKYPKSKFVKSIKAKKSGFLKNIDTYTLGIAAVGLGAGRKTKDDKIDYKAGIIFKVKLANRIKKNDVIATIFSDSKSKINTAQKIIADSIIISNKKNKPPRLIKKMLK